MKFGRAVVDSLVGISIDHDGATEDNLRPTELRGPRWQNLYLRSRFLGVFCVAAGYRAMHSPGYMLEVAEEEKEHEGSVELNVVDAPLLMLKLVDHHHQHHVLHSDRDADDVDLTPKLPLPL